MSQRTRRKFHCSEWSFCWNGPPGNRKWVQPPWNCRWRLERRTEAEQSFLTFIVTFISYFVGFLCHHDENNAVSSEKYFPLKCRKLKMHILILKNDEETLRFPFYFPNSLPTHNPLMRYCLLNQWQDKITRAFLTQDCFNQAV